MKKIFAAIFVVVVALGVGTFIYVKQKVSPEELKRLAVTYTAKNFPNVNLDIGEIGMSLGLKVSFVVEKLVVQEKVKGKLEPALQIDGLEIVVPVWSILMGGGNIEISVVKPVIHVMKRDGKLNLNTMFLGSNGSTVDVLLQPEAKSSVNDGHSPEKLEIPTFIANSTINARVSKAIFLYDLGEQKGEIGIEKILLKNLGLTGQPAFEINSNFSLDLESDKLMFGATLIGQVDISKLMTGRQLIVESVLKIEQARMEKAGRSIPDIKIETTTKYELIGRITSSFNSVIGTNNKVAGDVVLFNNSLNLSKLNCSVSLDEIIEITSLKNELPIQSNGASLVITGSVSINEQGRISNNLEWATDRNVEIKLDGLVVGAGIKGNFIERQFANTLNGGLLNGNYSLTSKGMFDLNQKEFAFEKVGPIEIDMIIDHIQVDEKILKKMTERTENVQAVNAGTTMPTNRDIQEKAKGQSYNIPILPEINVQIQIKESLFNSDALAAQAKIKMKGQSIVVDKFSVAVNEGNLAGKLNAKIYKNRIDGSTQAEIKSLNISVLQAFIPKIFNQISGDFSGNLKADFSLPAGGSTQYNFSTTASIKDGQLTGLNLKDFLVAQLGDIPNAEKSENLPISQNFRILTATANGDQNILEIKQSHFIGVGEKVEIKSNGKLFMPGTSGQSELLVDVTDHSGILAKSLAKYAATNTVPLKLKGKEFTLAADYGYTVQKLANSALQNKGKEMLKEKAPELIKEHLPEKLQENKNIKKLLKRIL